MAVRLSKDWIPLDAEHVEAVTCHLGVYQLGNAAGDIVYIGVAGGRARYGLKGELRDKLPDPPAHATQFRTEINMMYRSRHFELLQAYLHDHGNLPSGNDDIDANSLGRIRPYG